MGELHRLNGERIHERAEHKAEQDCREEVAAVHAIDKLAATGKITWQERRAMLNALCGIGDTQYEGQGCRTDQSGNIRIVRTPRF